MDKHSLTNKIKAEALNFGFSFCGIAPANAVEDEAYLSKWLTSGKNAGMEYMANHFEKRCNPALLVEGTRSILSVALNYYPKQKLGKDRLQFAWYAYGKDYHDVMKQKLTELFHRINELTPINGRVFCDTAPVLERYWAWRAGLGWIGKNTQLIIPHAGSCFFLGELFLDIELDYDIPQKNHCGKCRLCLDSCPSGALEEPFVLNACKCLSYLTIENKGDIPSAQAKILGKRIYGCDECQKICPHNRFAIPTNIQEFYPSKAFMNYSPNDWKNLTIENYQTLFKGTAVKRAKYEGLMRNIRISTQTSEE